MKAERRGFIFSRVGVRIAGHHRFLRIPAGMLRAAALGVWTAALGFSREEQLDGFCPVEALQSVATEDVINRLVDVGLFARDEQDGVHGVRILKYDDFNDTKAEIEASRLRERTRKGEYRTNPKPTRPKGVRKVSRGTTLGLPADSQREPAGTPLGVLPLSLPGSLSPQDLLDQRIYPPATPPQDLLDAREPPAQVAGVLDTSETRSETRIRSTLRPLPGAMGQAEIDRRRAAQLRALSDLEAKS